MYCLNTKLTIDSLFFFLQKLELYIMEDGTENQNPNLQAIAYQDEGTGVGWIG